MSNQDPNRPEIITRTAFGGKSAVALGGNRYSTKSETLFKAANFVALPARGLVVDTAIWLAGAATVLRIPFSLAISGALPPYMAIAIAALLLAVPLTAISSVAKEMPSHAPDCWVRVALLVAAVAIASNGFWVRAFL